MITRIPDYFDDFHCLAGACPDTCCGQWEIVVDDEAYARYEAIEGEFGEKLRSCLTEINGERCMKLEEGRCPFLAADGLCDIISHLGEEHLSTICSSHPRFTEIYGGLQETMLSLSCPEAARLLLQRQEPLHFVTRIDSRLPEPDDLDADEFDLLLGARQTAILLVQDRSRPLSDRLALMLGFARRLQDNLTRDLPFCESLCRKFEDKTYQDKFLLRIRRKRRHGTMIRVRQLLLGMEHLSDRFPALVREAECPDLSQNSVQLEHLCVYFLFRWWLKAACDDDLWQQAAATVIRVLTIASTGKLLQDMSAAAGLYSKEVEHSEDNLSLLREAMGLDMFCYEELLKLLEVSHAI